MADTAAGSKDAHESSRAKGPRSLAAMAMDVLAEHMAELEGSHLSGLSASMVIRLWSLLKERRKLSLHAWKLLLPLLHNGEADDGKPSYLEHYAEHWPSAPLSAYTEPLCSPGDFLVHLRITAVEASHFGAQELLQLAKMPNLAVLEILERGRLGGGGGGASDETPVGGQASAFQVSDRLLRGWSLQPNAFPRLRILRLWGSRYALTDACLQFATRLPALAVFDVAVENTADWRRGKRLSQALGWERHISLAKADDLVTAISWLNPQQETASHIRVQGVQGEQGDECTPAASGLSATDCLGFYGHAQDKVVGHWATGLYSYLSAQGYDSVGGQPGGPLEQTPPPLPPIRALPVNVDGLGLLCRPFATLSLGRQSGPSRSLHSLFPDFAWDSAPRNYVFCRTPASMLRASAQLLQPEQEQPPASTAATRFGSPPRQTKRKRTGYDVGGLLESFGRH